MYCSVGYVSIKFDFPRKFWKFPETYGILFFSFTQIWWCIAQWISSAFFSRSLHELMHGVFFFSFRWLQCCIAPWASFPTSAEYSGSFSKFMESSLLPSDDCRSVGFVSVKSDFNRILWKFGDAQGIILSHFRWLEWFIARWVSSVSTQTSKVRRIVSFLARRLQ